MAFRQQNGTSRNFTIAEMQFIHIASITCRYITMVIVDRTVSYPFLSVLKHHHHPPTAPTWRLPARPPLVHITRLTAPTGLGETVPLIQFGRGMGVFVDL